jgi:YD repeat-containing protein
LQLNAQDRTTRQCFDGDGRLVLTINPAGAVTHRTYDGCGQVVIENQLATLLMLSADKVIGLAEALALLQWNAADRRHYFIRDCVSQLVMEVDALGFFILQDYDLNGNSIREVHGSIALDLEKLSALPVSNLNAVGIHDLIVFSPDDRIQYRIFDRLNHLRFHIDPERYVTEYQYDSEGRKTATIRYAMPLDEIPTLSETVFQEKVAQLASDRDRKTETFYDSLNRVTKTRDALGSEESFVYNGWDQVIEHHDKQGAVWTTEYTRCSSCSIKCV